MGNRYKLLFVELDEKSYKIKDYSFWGTLLGRRFYRVRNFSLWQFLIGRKRRYYSTCDRIEYHTDGDMSIVGPSCACCGRNEVMESIFERAFKNKNRIL